jgi:octaprenyl-diphosphate synthase
MSETKDKIVAEIKDDLAEIETALKSQLTPYLDLVLKTASHILFNGGKRLRPLLMVLSARICDYRGKDDKKFSCIFEYLHAATLLHDDLVDGAELRRGKPVAHNEWGNSTAVLVGDFMLARALSVAAETGSLKVIRIISKVTEDMTQGEIHQLQNRENLSFSEEEYLEMIRRKTAMLIQGACRVGAVIAGANEKKEAALSVYGFNLGMAFQMADDLLDYLADTQILGKNIGADLKEGKLTLPVIYTLKTADQKDREFAKKMIADKDFSVQDFEKLIELLKKYGGLRYTIERATENISAAKQALSIFKPTKTKKLLEDIADYALGRSA